MADRERDRFVALAFCRADILLELDDDLNVVFAAGALQLLLGHGGEALRKRPFLELIAEPDRALAADMLEASRAQGRIDDVILQVIGQGARRPVMAMAGYRVPDFDDHFFLALKLEPALQSAHLRAEEITRDTETGLPDCDSYVALAADRAQAYRRAGGRPQLTLVKLNGLADLNAALEASDRRQVMNSVAEILNQHSLGGGSAGRISEDSVSYLHRDDVDPDDIAAMIDSAAKALFSGGLKPESHTLDADGAGLAEHQVAKAIAHTIRRFSENDDMSRQKSLAQVLKSLVSDTMDNVVYIRKLIKERDFDLAFMPVCDFQLEKVHHFEALTRFRDARAGTSPYHLFCLAEEVGIVSELDFAVCETAIRTLAELTRKRGLMPATAINLSGLSLTDAKFVEELGKLLGRSGVQPRKIMFEITESAKIEHLPEANAVIQNFRNRGFRFCLDDFGSGAASFDYLNALDVDIVKFDGPVVKRAAASDKGSELLKSMARMCASMGVKTTAEMVEDKRMAARIRECGVDYGQGWHFGKPDFDPFIFASRFVGNM